MIGRSIRMSPEEQERIERALSLVRRVAREVARCYPFAVSTPADLLGPGTLGLIEADRRFTRDKSASYERYAQLRVRGAMLDAIGSEALPAAKRVELAMERAAARQQILDAEDGGVGPRMAAAPTEDQADAVAEKALALAFGALAITVEPDAEAEAARRETYLLAQEAFRRAFDALLPEQRDLLVLHFEQRRTLEQIAELYETSEKTIRQRLSRATSRLRAAMRARGFTHAPEVVDWVPNSTTRMSGSEDGR